jgi:glycosyltransferase involved in cell wall biosynthesis
LLGENVMRIAHISVTYPPHPAGVGNVCFAYTTGLARRGHEVHAYTAGLPGAPVEETIQGVRVHRLQTLFRLGEARLVPGLLKVNGFDLLHLHLPFYLGAELVSFASRRSRTPLVITYHMDTLLRGLSGIIARLHDRLIYASVLRRAERVFFTTLDYGNTSRAGWLLEDQKSTAELPNGVDIDLFRPDLDGNILRQRLGIQLDERVILLVAGLDSAHFYKGVPILLQAFQKINDLEQNRNRRSRLVIVGEGNLRPTYQAMMIRLGLANKVLFAGRVSDADLPFYYAAADIGVLPSFTMGEAFGIVLLEAMACAKPVVASRLPGVRDVVNDGKDGFLVTPGDVDDLTDKLNALLDDASLCRRMGQAGYEKVRRKYAWPILVDQLIDHYRQILDGDGLA